MMGRMTRAKAAEVAEKLEIPEDDVLVDETLSTPQKEQRAALAEIAPNSGDSRESETELKKSTRGKGGRKGKGKKKDLAASTATLPETIESEENEAAKSPAGEAVAEEHMPNAGETVLEIVEEKSLQEGQETGAMDEPSNIEPTSLHNAMDAPPSPLPSAMPNVIASLRKDMPSMRSTSNKENVEPLDVPTPTATPRLRASYDALEAAAIQAATPPGLSREPSATQVPTTEATPLRAEGILSPKPADPISTDPASADPITAMDALEDAMDEITAAVETPTLPEQPKVAKKEKPAPVVKTTKASLARMSLAQADKKRESTAPSLGRPRPSTVLGRASSVRESTVRPAPASKRISSATTQNSTAASTQPREKKEAIIPHSKPRPISLSFPTPPPPPKSTKAPTQSTFRLPGEEIAAKLKAAREERSKREVEKAPVEQKKAPFKARPVPAGLSKAPSVRQTNASKARESMMGGRSALAPPVGGHKRASSATVSTTASRNLSAAVASTTSRQGVCDRLSVARQRPSTALANTSKPRVSLTSSTTSSAQRVASSGTSKGKEIFNRAAVAKSAAEKEKREKEEAAKKARAMAAERGRQLSREWAEKQKMKKAAAVVKKDEGTPA